MAGQHQMTAQSHLYDLSRNPYPGRGIVVGLDETSEYLVQVYWIMGRSENSRNRVFSVDAPTGRVYTEAADATKMTNPDLVIYNAMRESGRHFIVSNGKQTDALVDRAHIQDPTDLNRALVDFKYEPDSPNFTPRITAVSSWYNDAPAIRMSILRKSQFGDGCDRAMYECVPHAGFGFCITTYAGDGDPLPPFCGDPLTLPLYGRPKDILGNYWTALNEANRVSLAVKFIERRSGRSQVELMNKYAKKE